MSAKPNKGFSLIEVMLVMVIIALAAAWAVPQYLEYTQIARRADAVKSLTQMLSQQELFYSNNGGTYTSLVNNIGYAPKGTDLGETVSEDGHYVITMAGCGAGIADCVSITATADQTGQQAKDYFCYSFTINSRGQTTNAPSPFVSVTPPLNFSCWE